MIRRRPLVALAALCLIFTPAGLCGPSDDFPEPGFASCLADEAPPADGQPALVIGTGEDATFVPLTSGATLEMFEGSQGGAHVNVSLRGFLPQTDPDTHYHFDMTYSAGGSGIAEFRNDCAGQWQESPTQRLFLDEVAPSSGTLTVSIAEDGGAAPLVTAEVDIVVTQ